MGENELEMMSPDISENTDDIVEDNASDDDSSPAPSTEATDDDKFDLLSVVRDAVPSEEAGDSASSSEETEGSTDTDGDAAESDAEKGGETDEENFSDVPFHNHPRFKQLIAQRNQFREGATEYAKVQSFLQQSGVTAEEAADALSIQAMLKQNPQEAWNRLKPIVQQLVRDVGLVLPEDLQQRVQKGELTKEAANEISRLRSANATADRQAEHREQQSQRDAAQEKATAVQTAVAKWETEQRKDPDFAAKAEDLMREVVWLQSKEGKPDTPEGATKQLQKAMDTVNDKVAKRQKPRPSITPVTGGRAARTTNAGEPTSILDVVKAAGSSG